MTRIDKWLWAARFFKTLGLAAEAIDGGKVEVNGDRAKRSRTLHVGDRVRIRLGPYEPFIPVHDNSRRPGRPTGAAPLGLAAAPAADGSIATSAGPLAVGGVWRIELGVDPQAPSGTYSARLAALSSTGGLATLDVKIVLWAALPERGAVEELSGATFDLERSVLAWLDGGRLKNGGRIPMEAVGR